MALFRKRLTPEQAFDSVLAAISRSPTPPKELPIDLADAGGDARVRHEQTYLSLFAAMMAVKFCRRRDWRDNGFDLFVALSARVTQRLIADRGNAVVPVGERIEYYNMSLVAAGSDVSRRNLSREVGIGFTILLTAEDSPALSTLGQQTFLQAFDRVAEVTSTFKL